MSRYQSGADAERYVKRKLEADGYKVVRAAGSKGMADMIAANSRVVWAIQVKSSHLTKAAVAREGQKLLDWIGDSMFQPMLVHKLTNAKNSPYEFLEIRMRVRGDVG